MIDEDTGLEVPPEIAAATLEAEAKAKAALDPQLLAMCEHAQQVSDCGPYTTSPLCTHGRVSCAECRLGSTEALPVALIPFEEFERRIKLLKENGVRSYRDNVMQVQIDTYKRQPDPAAIAETFST
jgi:hypothetical protein